MMKISDYIADFLAELGIKDIFLISGGGMMHLLDSVGNEPRLNLVCNLNEQASSICADSYGQFTNQLGVCMLTTGPGGTNAVTGIAASYLDSTPVLAISGQCKTSDSASLRGVRQFGAQEVDIVSIVKPITKYAQKITDKTKIRYYLEKAIYLAQHGRKGPVWLDIPLDIQAAQIEPEELESFDPVKEYGASAGFECSQTVKHVYELLKSANRPAILVGGGVTLSGAREEIKSLIKALKVPVLSTWRAKDIFTSDFPGYYGSPGVPGLRSSNYILQNCDLLIVLGTRLNNALTAFDQQHFAFQAKKVIVDVDPKEIEKLKIEFEETLVCDAGEFIRQMLVGIKDYELPKYDAWFEFCDRMMEKYPLDKEIQPDQPDGFTDGYLLAQKISKLSDKNDIWAGSSSGRACGISHMAVQLKEGQRFISSLGLGSMGFTVPSAISCCIASGNRRTLAIEGDGSLQHNIQELQLITSYQLPIKLFILENGGYASIYMMQKNNFKSNFCACNPETHVSFPEMEQIAKMYGLDYYQINCNNEIEPVLEKVMADNRPVLCKVKISLYFNEIPKSMTIAHPDGTFSSSRLENLYPFLPEEEVAENMPDWSQLKG